jgi:hypothetical protein
MNEWQGMMMNEAMNESIIEVLSITGTFTTALSLVRFHLYYLEKW